MLAARVACGPAGLMPDRAAMGRPLDEAMGRFATGDDDALGEVYDLAAPALFAFLVRLTRDRSRAEDLTHDVFVKLHHARALYRPGAEVMPWAYTIARHLFLDSMRSGRREVLADSNDERPSDPGRVAPDVPADELIAARQLADRIEQTLATMPEAQATAFRLLKQEYLSVAEAAAVLGTTEAAVKLRAHRAYEVLRRAVGETWDAPARTLRKDSP